MIDFPDNFLFSIFSSTLKYVNMIRISNMSFFRFCWKNEKNRLADPFTQFFISSFILLKNGAEK